MLKPADNYPALPGYERFRFESGGLAHAVYRGGDRAQPPLLVMPEIAGMSPGLLLFTERLQAAGFQVYVPWLFGPFQQRAPVRNAMRLCISREFARLRDASAARMAARGLARSGCVSQGHSLSHS